MPSTSSQEQVDPRHRLAAARLERPARERLRLGHLLVGERRRHQELRRRRPRTCRRRSRSRRRARSPRAPTPSADRRRAPRARSRVRRSPSSTTIHSSYDEGDVDRLVELGAVARLRHADRRAEVGRLHEARVPELALDLRDQRVAVVAVAELDRRGVRQAGGGEGALHHHLVHRHRGAEHARTDVRAGRPARAGPAPCRPRRTDRGAAGTPRRRRAHRSRAPPPPSTSNALGQRVGATFDGALRGVGEEPTAVGGDRDRHHVVARRGRAPAPPRPRSRARRRARPIGHRRAAAPAAGARRHDSARLQHGPDAEPHQEQADEPVEHLAAAAHLATVLVRDARR